MAPAMYEGTISALDRVMNLNRERNAAIQTIRETKTTMINRVRLPVDESTKTAKIEQVNRLFRQRAKAVYDEMNLDRLKAGLPILKNPYETKGK